MVLKTPVFVKKLQISCSSPPYDLIKILPACGANIISGIYGETLDF